MTQQPHDVWLELSSDHIKASIVAIDTPPNSSGWDPSVSAEIALDDSGLEALAPFDTHGNARSMAAVLANVQAALIAVCGEGRGAHIRRVMLAPAERSVVAIGRENTILTPVLFRPAEDDLQAAPGTYLAASVADEVRRYASATAWLVNWFSREWIGLERRAPLGLPTDPATGTYILERAVWTEANATLTWSPLLVPPGAIMAQVIPMRARPLGLPDFTPIVGWLGS